MIAADRLGYRGARPEVYIRLDKVDGRKCFFDDMRYRNCRGIGFTANRSAVKKFEFFLQTLASNAAFWHEAWSGIESCNVVCRFESVVESTW